MEGNYEGSLGSQVDLLLGEGAVEGVEYVSG